MKTSLFKFLFLLNVISFAQEKPAEVMSLSEYLGYVKAFHPIVKQANLIIHESEAKLLKERGAFDPKIEIDRVQKTFKNTEYYDKLNATFKIPTWYGIEFKGNFEENDGFYLNPESNVPDEGLYSVGVSVSIAQNLLINKRMAMLKQAKFYVQQAKADRTLMINDILFEATSTYFNWLKTYKERLVFEDFLENADMRFKGIKKSYELGEFPAIDTLEARITLNTRKLELEKARIKYIKSSLELSNFLWINDNTPIEIRERIIPDTNTMNHFDSYYQTMAENFETNNFENHPKLQSLDYKYKSLEIDKRLKLNLLLPKIDLHYNFLSETPEIARSFSTSAYKNGFSISVPLFLRKERGDLNLAKIKLQNTAFEIQSTRVTLKNKVEGITQELQSYKSQTAYTDAIVNDYETLLNAEDRKFFLGESSLFLVNSRESKLMDAKLKAISIENQVLLTKASLLNTLSAQNIQ
ncbi:MAG: TolC family protein [Flavobacteriales bacterium]|nr:TolC family protein [Flavobacteriia bacterium]NCP06334.1 TolC family protein [Flavobacteriales bacterium]PIV94334.1 MAG: transporter [Flavobacteriaceae bacterium CG17_big_fil_post_rev_8_21_14_2_50_33_15]PIY13252.1 MAG: transporter [Flavobacteriaceae bacterium CG_4_10_14_3_um_filter_33_47]PJB18637.1 MAG: transporter [Flavobacteriaceae bacterium CG_4_9_14_3_um_filter_33_16]